MPIRCLTNLDDWASLAARWNALTGGVPFRRHEWLATWWRHYGDEGRRSLFVVAVVDDEGQLLGAAPWYLERSATHGTAIRWLGSGEICSDYLSILTTPAHEPLVVAALAEYLTGDARGCWDLLDLSHVESTDGPVNRLVQALGERGCLAHERPGPNCWRLQLPATWDQYQADISKSHRKQMRRLETRVLDTDRARLHHVATPNDWQPAWDVLVDLHQRRRKSLGEPGCFSWPRFAAFHREVSPTMLAVGALRLDWLELDGRPIAVEYHFGGGPVVFAYQSGVDPERLDEEPGRLITIALLRSAIAGGFEAIDFLRGDEPYKAHWRAEPRTTTHWRIVPPRTTARVRHGVWLAGRSLKRLVSGGATPVKVTPES